MQAYKNISGHSGVAAYEIADHAITVKFTDGDIYLYSYGKPGPAYVEEMKKLAVLGIGLATYINTSIRGAYDQKIA